MTETDLEEFGLHKKGPPESGIKMTPAIRHAITPLRGLAKPIITKVPRRCAVHFPITKIKPGKTKVIKASPLKEAFQGQKIISCMHSAGLVITGITVAGISQFPAGVRNVSLEHYHQNVLSNGTKFDTCNVGQDVAFTIENIGSSTATVSLALIGTPVLP